MKSLSNARIEVVNDAVEAQIVGKSPAIGALARALESRHVGVVSYKLSKELDVSLSPTYVFWFPVLQEEEPTELLTNFVSSVGARLTIVYVGVLPNDRVLSMCLQKNVDVRMAVLEDLYGPLTGTTPLSPLWKDLQASSIPVFENDDDVISPLYIDDAAEALCKAAFSSQTFGKTLWITGETDMTILNFVYRIREETARRKGVMPQLVQVDKSYFPLQMAPERRMARKQTIEILSWHPETDLSSGVKHLVAAVLGDTKKGNIEAEPPEKNIKKNAEAPLQTNRQEGHRPRPPAKIGYVKRLLIAIAGGCFFFGALFSPLLYLRIISWRISVAQQQIGRAIADGNTADVERRAKEIEQLANMGIAGEQFAGPAWKLLRQQDAEEKTHQKFLVAKGRTSIEKGLADIAHQLSLLTSVMTGASQEYASVMFDRIEAETTGLLSRVGALVQLQDGLSEFGAARQLLSAGRELLPVAKWAAGMDKKRTLLIVLQNSSELRPTGGFMSDIGFLTFEKGKLLDLSFIDIYQLDGQLPGREDPPEQIRTLLGEQSWLARDANWSPDAPTAAIHIQDVVSRATGRKTDGVVFVTTNGLKTILKRTGPVNLPNGDMVTADSIIEQATFSGDTELEGTSRTNVLPDAARALRDYMNNHSSRAVVQGIFDALARQEILVTTADASIAPLLMVSGIDGRVQTPTCPVQFLTEACVLDSMFVVDANLGVNKADYYLRREREVNIKISKDKPIETELMLRYINAAASSARPAGAYRGYTRVYLPLGTEILSVVRVVPDGVIDVSFDASSRFGKREVGMYVDVPIGSESLLKLTYKSAQPLKFVEGVGGYDVLLQKQPGVESIDTIVTISYADDLIPIVVSPEPKTANQGLYFYLGLDKTSHVGVAFSPTR